MKRVQLAILVTMLLATSTRAVADDVFPPTWRYDYGTVTVAWDTWGAKGWGSAIVSGYVVQANPGGFTAPSPPPPFWLPFWAYYSGQVYNSGSDLMYGRDNVLYVTAGNSLSFSLANYDNPQERKDMIVQITFLKGFGAPMNFNVGTFVSAPGDPPLIFPDTRAAIVSQGYDHGDGWQTNSYYIPYTPNPAYEGFSIDFTQYPAYIDQVVVDTRCIPEPSTLVLLGMGAIGLMSYAWPRRKR